MKRFFGILLVLTIMLVALVACAAPEPEVVIEQVEVVVTQVVEVEKEVEVEVEKIVEVEVEVEKIVEVAAELGNRGTLRIAHDLAWGGTENVDPVDSGRFWPVITMIYDSLAIQGTDGAPTPNLAQAWSANEAADVWTFELRQGVTFHDGSELTSADVAYSIEWWKNETSTIAPVVSIVESVETPDDYTVVMNLGQAHMLTSHF